jgi:hypothetical protein
MIRTPPSASPSLAWRTIGDARDARSCNAFATLSNTMATYEEEYCELEESRLSRLLAPACLALEEQVRMAYEQYLGQRNDQEEETCQ